MSFTFTDAIHNIRAFITSERQRIQLENSEATQRFGRFEVGLCVTVAVGLTAMNFLGDPRTFLMLFSEHISPLNTYWELTHLLYWVSACLVGYMLIPMLFLKIFKQRISTYYWGVSGFTKHPWGYLALLIPGSLLVYWVSFWPEFQSIYPFYSQAGRSWTDFFLWEIAYGLQFLALEFFFRAFILEGLRPSLGYGAIPVMVIPYCMIHFQKTAAESLGSVVAGFVLGWMAMRSRSLWGGVLVHTVIAVEMDLMSLIQKGGWPPP